MAGELGPLSVIGDEVAGAGLPIELVHCHRAWTGRYVRQLMAGDVLASVLVAAAARGIDLDGLHGFGIADYSRGWALLLVTWLLAMHAAGAYDIRHTSVGAEEFKRALRGTGLLVGALAVGALAFNSPLPRRLVLVDIPLVFVMVVLIRHVGRQVIHARRRRGQWTDRILAVGTPHSVRELAGVTQRASHAGLSVVAACVDGPAVGTEIYPGLLVVGDVASAAEAAAALDADVVAVAGHSLGARAVRELGWALEGTGRQLVMAPELTGVAGPRVHVSPVDGLPLMWVDQPQFGGGSRLVKRAVDIVGSLTLLLLSAPLLTASAIAVKVTSPGPALFRQVRLGKDGRAFRVVKFRTMVVDAEKRREELLHLNESSDIRHLYFKIKQDPRITPVGRILRKLSIDELPQLLNVLQGSMSLVGPRPLPGELELQSGDFRRRLLVKPGLSGLWQVSGRSELSAEDAVRLDLYYVENWSLTLDLAIIARTVWVVLRSRGAY